MSVATGMEVGFFFWPYDPDLVRRMATRADRYGYALAGIADTPGNAMDPWALRIRQAMPWTRGLRPPCWRRLRRRCVWQFALPIW